MSFGSGGFGFGQSNTTQQPSAFGGGAFGSSNTGSAFGQNNNTTFGANNTNTGGGLFGGASTGGFGSTGSAFGSNNTTSAFGANANKPAFGSTGTTGGGLFGASSNTTATPSAFGGFGSSTTAAPSTSGFGSGTSLFGASKPATTTGAFGSGTTGTTGGSLFGGGSTTGGGFGSTTGTAFGATSNPGIGTNIGDPPGTNTVAFQPTVEKELNNSAQQNSFQNILFQDAYKKWSADELRLVDYNQGRRFGNGTGTGAFGVNSSFGSGGGFGTNNNTGGTGFGTNTTGGGLFGNNNTQTTTSAFGSQPAATGGFGSGGGLFGSQQNKPAGGLFGSSTTQPATQSGGLFGASNTSAFGSNNNTTTGGGFGSSTTTTGGGLFGGGANANASKPGGFGFGTQQPAASTTGSSFGGTGAFGGGASTTTSLFGNNNNQQTQQQGGGLFGNSAQTNTGSAFGSGGAFGSQNQQQGTSSLFGQNKPAGGLFGSSTTTNNTGGGGLFGNSNNNSTTSAFGAANNTQTGGGLFGGAKPAATTGGLFGNSTTNQQGTTGGGLFGNTGAAQTQQQPAAGGSLFGGSLGQNQQKPSLFGNSQATGGGLFGNNNNQQQQQQGGGLFGGSQQQSTLGNSLFGNSQNQSQPQALTTSLSDMSAFGTSSLFAGVGANDVQNPGPLATPLSSAKKQPARASILPIYRLSKPQTPKRGFGFSYSTYGSPSTPSSANSTPGGFGQSLLAGSLGRSLNKSISTSSLRRSFNAEDSILAPGAFSASTGPRNHGSMGRTKLVINRDIRSDLFSTPSKDRHPPELVNPRKVKRVSFDPSTATAAIEQGESNDGEETPSGSAEDLGYIRPATRMTNGVNGSSQSNSADAGPEMEQVKGNELAIVHEEESPQRASGSNGDSATSDYWMSPSKEEIQNMNRVQRQKVTDFTVGRHGIGKVRFRVPVDLSNINLDEIFVELVQFSPRSCTVYPNPAKKPAMGKGLNVPAEITLENSWPRGREKPGSRGHQKHIERLKRIPDTEFVDYNAETGIWVFRVEHFTTYGLDDDDEDDDTEMNQSDAQSGFQVRPRQGQDPDHASMDTADPYTVNRPQRHVPGAFDPAAEAEVIGEVVPDHRLSVRPPSPTTASDSASDDLAADHVQDHVDLEMTVEDDLESPEAAMAQVTLHDSTYLPADAVSVMEAPAGIMRARMRAIRESTAPARYEVTGGDDWMDILKKSVNSGRPRDRAALQISQEVAVNKLPEQPARDKSGSRRVVSDGRGFATSIDLMNSLFGKDKISAADDAAAFVQPAKSFIKWPYQKQHQDGAAGALDLDDRQRQLRNSFKPRWGPDNKLLMAKSPGYKQPTGNLLQISTGISTQAREVWSLKLSHNASTLGAEPHHRSWIATRFGPGNVPEVVQPESVPLFKDILNDLSTTASATSYEVLVWELASILFDPIDGSNVQLLRRRKLSEFWQRLVQDKTSVATAEASRSDEKAFLSLAGHQVADACKHLLDGKNYKLATLTSMMGTSDKAREDMAEQVQVWHDGDVLSEIESPLRAIYGLLAGNVAVCEGKTGAGSENRLDTLVFSNRFGLDWQQSFGLRLWYGISTGDDISKAIEKADEDMSKGLIAEPRPWYLDEAAREDKENSENTQDLMWGLLKLYAGKAKLEDVLRPESCSSSHTDYSLCWQLGQLLSVAGKASFESHSKADSLTVSYGAQLMEKMHWSQAVTVLLHLSDKTSRAKAVRDVIARVAMEFANTPYNANEQNQQGVKQLLELEQFHIPKAWIAEACALAYRYLANGQDCTHPVNFGLVVKEVRCLALAEQPQELHTAVVRRLDPLAILQWHPERDLERLVRYLRARPVNDGLADIAVLASIKGQDIKRQARSAFDYDRYLAMLSKRYEETDERDVVTLAALATLTEWVENKRLNL
ncbi:hypothetical protein PpBr36_00305 [Pyricularia pennisetigena]|uniref:hypothetical protein n=1 Tax=Pyricularia pennisetigena TaxID=1578925 RepID=UPI001152DD2A|nr:hypothetical protein PpBr36_00305 [Pyricularia pennisetigena]TLS28835.1 hypothetical protein PpBr36_00305 [Pyricularia pennisetigena]